MNYWGEGGACGSNEVSWRLGSWVSPLTCSLLAMFLFARRHGGWVSLDRHSIRVPEPQEASGRSTGTALVSGSIWRDSRRGRILIGTATQKPGEVRGEPEYQNFPKNPASTPIKGRGGENLVLGSWGFIICLECLLPAFIQSQAVQGSSHKTGSNASHIPASTLTRLPFPC